MKQCGGPLARAAKVDRRGSIISYLRKCHILGRAAGCRGSGRAVWVPSSLGKTDKLERISGNVADCRTSLLRMSPVEV